MLDYDALEIGAEIPSRTFRPISRHTLALYCGASGDHNPIHVDIDFARAAGMPDVFAHGMLSMAYLGRMLTGWVPQSAIRSFATRFTAITQIGAEVTCTGKVAEKFEVEGEKRLRLEIQAADQNGEVKLAGEAVVAVQ